MEKNILKDFNNSRTPFFVSFAFLLIESIIPGLVIWLTVGYDFKFSLSSKLPYPNVGYNALICASYFLFSFLITFLFFEFKWHKSDNFVFSLSTSLIFICITLLGSVINNKNIWILVKFIIILLVIILATPLFVVISLIFKNQQLKKEEELEKILQAYKQGEVIPSKKLLKAQKHQKYLLEKQKQQQDLEDFKKNLYQKINEQLLEKDQEKINKINQKLDKKEDKQRKKEKF